MGAVSRAAFPLAVRSRAWLVCGPSSIPWMPTIALLTARINGSDPVVTVCSFEGRRIVTVKDYRSMEAAEAAIAGPSQAPAERWWRRWRPGSRR
jgi:hypothetical protein